MISTKKNYALWGNHLEPDATAQMDNAMSLPIALRGALMPDAHVGYGLPIGGVLATENAVIPYAVGVDIACRMKLTVLDWPVAALESQKDLLIQTLERETRFGIGAEHKKPLEHAVMDEDWNFSKLTRELKSKAWKQLGTSGSGNHFVEYGTLSLTDSQLGIPTGIYFALLSHSGSRGTGASIADFYSKLARSLQPQLPKTQQHLAWLDLDSEPGQAYWQSMQLMGLYAAANHALIHRNLARTLGAQVLLDIENHHNFAWREVHDGKEVVVHRKGATPAGVGVLGIIPGSMTAPGFIVRGKGNAASLNSAAHGAGRRMSRTQAKKTFDWNMAKEILAKHRVTLISAGLDELPMAYKDIETVMQEQQDLVEVCGCFQPRIVKMAPAGERPED